MNQTLNRSKAALFGYARCPNLSRRIDMKRTTPLFLLPAFFASLQLQANPNITLQPASRTNNVGDNAQFTVGASGSGTLSYQWQFNTVNISGATTNTLNVAVDRKSTRLNSSHLG